MTRASEWATRVAAWRASGKTAKEFCKGRDYTAGRLLWWSSDLKRRGIGPASGNSVALTRVIRKREASLQSMSVVVHFGDIRVEVPAGTDRATLSTVLDVLSARAEAGGHR
jgi:transposase